MTQQIARLNLDIEMYPWGVCWKTCNGVVESQVQISLMCSWHVKGIPLHSMEKQQAQEKNARSDPMCLESLKISRVPFPDALRTVELRLLDACFGGLRRYTHGQDQKCTTYPFYMHCRDGLPSLWGSIIAKLEFSCYTYSQWRLVYFNRWAHWEHSPSDAIQVLQMDSPPRALRSELVSIWAVPT